MDSIERLKKTLLLVGIALAVALSLPTTTVAQEASPELSAEEKKEVARYLLEAKRAYSSKDYDVALERLESAYAIYPDVNIERRIGETLERLRRDREALETYRRILAREDVEPSMRDAVERRVTFLSDLLEQRRATVRVSSNLADTLIFVGDEAEPRGTAPIEIPLEPGTYELRAELPERESRTFDVTVTEREVVDWSVEWQVVERTEPDGLGEVDRDAPPPVEASSSNATAWLFLGIGVASYVAAGATFALASSVGSRLDDYDRDRDLERPSDYSELETRHNNFVIASWIGAGIGTIATGIGAFLLFSSGDETAEVKLVPGTDGARVEMRLRW